MIRRMRLALALWLMPKPWANFSVTEMLTAAGYSQRQIMAMHQASHEVEP